jgi:hypothetical protein
MPKIFLIGRSATRNDYKDSLVTLGYSITKFDSLDKSIRSLREKADVIIADKSLSSEPSFKDFLNLSKSIPKIIISATHSFRGFTPWIKENMIYPLFAPEAKELAYFIKRLLDRKSVV